MRGRKSLFQVVCVGCSLGLSLCNNTSLVADASTHKPSELDAGIFGSVISPSSKRCVDDFKACHWRGPEIVDRLVWALRERQQGNFVLAWSYTMVKIMNFA